MIDQPPSAVRAETRRTFLEKTASGFAAALAAASHASAALGAAGPAPARAEAASAGDTREIRDAKTKIRIGVFDVAFRDLSTSQFIEQVKELKLEAVEIGSGNDPGNPHCDREALPADDAKRRDFAALFEKNGLIISAFSCHGNPVHQSHGVFLRLPRRRHRQAPQLDTIPGDGGVRRYPRLAMEGSTDPYWKDLAAHARARKVKVAIEMDSGYSVFNVATLLKLRQAVGDNVGANLDFSGIFQLGIEPVAVVKKLGAEGALFHMHGKDILIDQQNTAVNGLVDLTPYEDLTHRSWSYADIGFGHDLVVWKAIAEELVAVG
ncbi:MAG TPA: sugar phosphate isomerase/epimerase [Terriglobia bacterium]|nr:sugar phosphate isomerase/epimerase [Terriglobia bacterium]